MKKHVLITLAFLTVCSFSANAQSFGKTVKQAEPQAMEKISASQQLPESMLKRAKSATKKQAIAAASDLVGKYVAKVNNLTYSKTDGFQADDPFYSGLGVEITAGEEDGTLNVTNFISGSGTLTLTVDVAEGTVTIPSQTVYSHSQYGNCDLQDAYVEATPVGTVDDEGNITFSSVYYLSILEGDYAGYRLGSYMTLSLVKANGYVEAYDLRNNAVTTWPVVISQDQTTYDVAVVNFADHEVSDTLTFVSEGKWNIAAQLAVDYYADYGDFYTFAYDADNDSITGTDIACANVSDNEIDWEGWTLYNAGTATDGSYYTYDAFKYGKLVWETDTFLGVAAGIGKVNTTAKPISRRIYTVSGAQTSKLQRGINIVETHYDDGTVVTTKVLGK